jgi:hypothetical protein
VFLSGDSARVSLLLILIGSVTYGVPKSYSALYACGTSIDLVVCQAGDPAFGERRLTLR